MQKIKCSEVLEAVGGKLISGGAETEILGVSIDSRKVNPGDLFIPIIGERFDGHAFIRNALEAGAAAALTQTKVSYEDSKTLIWVGDTAKAIRDLAAYYRKKFTVPFIGITGSVGKTSTKDMVACVLKQGFRVLKTEGNFNNEIGLPLTVFNLDGSHEAAVIEMGMSGSGEISRLTAIVQPDVAVITNIGMSHIEKLGSRQNILKAKMEIFEGLNTKGLVILNGDDKLLYGLKDLLKFRTVFYGMEDGMDYQAYNVRTVGENGTNFEIALGNREYKIHVPAPGIHNVYNALAAIAAGMELKLPMESIIKGISEFSSGNMRLNIIENRGFKILNDTYNASPQSMEAAIRVLKDISGKGRSVAVLGDMLELGDWTNVAHSDVGKFAVSKGIDLIVTVGINGREIANGALAAGAQPEKVFSLDNNMEAVAFLKQHLISGDAVLIKGSRGMKMEQIVEGLLVDIDGPT